MKQNKNLESILQLTPDMLEQISGGVMTESGEKVLNALIVALKNDTEKEHTPDEMIEFVTSKLMGNKNLEGVTEQDVADFVRARW
jgi:hypothetical protein